MNLMTLVEHEQSPFEQIPARDRVVHRPDMRVLLTPHALDRFRKRVMQGKDGKGPSVERIVEMAKDNIRNAQLRDRPPTWVNGTPRPQYLVVGNGHLVFPITQVADDTPGFHAAVTCLHRGDAEPDRLARLMREAGIAPRSARRGKRR